MKNIRWSLLLSALAVACLLILSATSCNTKKDGTEENSATAAPNDTAKPSQSGSAAAPQKQVPTFSAAQKLGLYVYPGNNQAHDQQLIDESECYDLAKQQSGVNPEVPAPKPPTSAEIQAASQQGAASAQQAKGGRLRGAARGAAGGAMIGAIAGDAGKGAAIGATVGTMGGGMRQRQANAASKNQAASQAGAALQEQYKPRKAAYDQQIGSFQRAFSACMDSRKYSVK